MGILVSVWGSTGTLSGLGYETLQCKSGDLNLTLLINHNVFDTVITRTLDSHYKTLVGTELLTLLLLDVAAASCCRAVFEAD